MSAQPLISIVTPSLNQGTFLTEALHSVRAQQYPNHQHLVLDGGSNDETVNILKAVSSSPTGSRLTWRSEPDDGQSAALNEGFAAATGEIIGWLNADDRYRPDCFAHVARAFAAQPEIDVLYGDYTFISPAGHHLALRREIEFSRFILNYHRVLYIPTTSVFFRRRIFEDGHFLRENLHYAMDLEFFIRLARLGYHIQHLPRVLADFRIHPASKSSQFTERQRKEHRSIVLNETPLARRFSSLPVRNTAASLLQLPAGMLRYSEKLVRGFYFREYSAARFIEEQVQGADPS